MSGLLGHAHAFIHTAESTKLRASATLPVDLKSPSKEATAKTSDGTASKSADSTDMLRQGLLDDIVFIVRWESTAAYVLCVSLARRTGQGCSRNGGECVAR